MLRPIDPRFLPHTMTVFNDVNGGARLVAVVIRGVNYTDSNAFNFKTAGYSSSANVQQAVVSTTNAFRVVVDCENSDYGARAYVPILDWRRLTEEEQTDGTRFTLYRDMWLFKGEHEEFPDNAIVARTSMAPTTFEALGVRLHRTTLFDVAGLDVPHNIQLAG